MEESIGIPFIVSSPSMDSSNGSISEPVSTEDLFPTMLGLCDIAVPSPLPGINLTPLITGRVQSLERQGIFLEMVFEARKGATFYERPWRGIRTSRYKYVVRQNPGSGQIADWCFFDLQEDPFEQRNLVGENSIRDERKRCKELLRDYIRKTDDPFLRNQSA